MQKVLWLVAAWALIIVGLLIMPLPIPVPLIGAVPLMVGLALLTTHSKMARRALQYTRHRLEWLSHAFERFAHRMPVMVRVMIRRTRPHAFVRHKRMRDKGPESQTADTPK
ncbi:MAG TPA: PGPGW domain-containing protein [Rhizomicrobium sp.]|jgi:hypothetical protein|nr:PGPGW domain-containing protein [Rhizomicrobium sp.]